MALKKEDILNLKRGELIQYSGRDVHGRAGENYLLVDEVDLERGVVSGELTSAYGVNNLSIDYLIQNGIRTTKWTQSKSSLGAQKDPKEMSIEELERKVKELEANHDVGLTYKSELALVQKPVDHHIIELVNRRMKKYT